MKYQEQAPNLDLNFYVTGEHDVVVSVGTEVPVKLVRAASAEDAMSLRDRLGAAETNFRVAGAREMLCSPNHAWVIIILALSLGVSSCLLLATWTPNPYRWAIGSIAALQFCAIVSAAGTLSGLTRLAMCTHLARQALIPKGQAPKETTK